RSFLHLFELKIIYISLPSKSREKLPNDLPLDINSCSANWTDIEGFIESVVQATDQIKAN
ncbi:MAG: hypothetical protein L0L23_10305, partial [Enterobacterales bacterium]|nr:hypothetical protein [Enterobacterales bacterium]